MKPQTRKVFRQQIIQERRNDWYPADQADDNRTNTAEYGVTRARQRDLRIHCAVDGNDNGIDKEHEEWYREEGEPPPLEIPEDPY